MAMYELDGNHLLPVRLGRSADAITLSHSLVAIQRQIVDVLRRPLFPLAWDELDGGASLTALDATGQVVVGFGMVAMGTVDEEGTAAAVSNLWSHGGFFPNGFTGFLGGFQIALFAFIGIEWCPGHRSRRPSCPPSRYR